VRATFTSVLFIVMLFMFVLTFAIKYCVRSRFSGRVHLRGYYVAHIAKVAESLVQDSASDGTQNESDANGVSVDKPCNADRKRLSKKSGLKGRAAKQPFCVAVGWIGA